MILGNGSLANKLLDRDGAIFFAKGVSDSSCTDVFRFRRESYHLSKYYDSDSCLFYFSSIGVAFNNSPYFKHKLEMEMLVDRFFQNYCILRIGNLEDDSNPTTFLNVLKNKIKNKEPYEVRDEWKYMITTNDLISITQSLPLKGGKTINVFSYMAKVKDLLK